MRSAARSLMVGLASWLASPSVAAAQPAAMPAPRIAAIAGDSDDVRDSTLVGRSGQVYAPDAPGTWLRHVAGGIAADVRGAVRIGGDLVVTGRAAPMYQFDGTMWRANPIGQRGRTVMGTGRYPAIAIGTQVFVQDKAGWVRVATAPAAVVALWAAGKNQVTIATATAVLRLRGSKFVAQTPATVATALVGTVPYALTATGIVDTAKPKLVPVVAITDVIAVVARPARARDLWLLTAPLGAAPALVPLTADKLGVPIPTPLPVGTTVTAMIADKAGRVLIATDAGTSGNVHIWDGSAWTIATVRDALPVATSGPGPARSQ